VKSICALCGRPTKPAVLIGNEAIGPKCARNAGLLSMKTPKGSRVKFLTHHLKSAKGPRTLDLFPELESHT
jgi:hypothetical protein